MNAVAETAIAHAASDLEEGALAEPDPVPGDDDAAIPVEAPGVDPANLFLPAQVVQATSAGVPSIDARPVNLPKDAIELASFKADHDKRSLEDFVFQLDLLFEAQPHVYDVARNPGALKMRLLVVVGCFPTGSVASVRTRLVSFHVQTPLVHVLRAVHGTVPSTLSTVRHDARFAANEVGGGSPVA